MSKRLAKRFDCPGEFALAVLDGKWKMAILRCLELGPCRYAELRKWMPHVSDKMLSERLHDLVNSGLVVRSEFVDVSNVRMYRLSPLGRSLEELMSELTAWGIAHSEAFGVELRTVRSASAKATVLTRRLEVPTRLTQV